MLLKKNEHGRQMKMWNEILQTNTLISLGILMEMWNQKDNPNKNKSIIYTNKPQK